MSLYMKSFRVSCIVTLPECRLVGHQAFHGLAQAGCGFPATKIACDGIETEECFTHRECQPWANLEDAETGIYKGG